MLKIHRLFELLQRAFESDTFKDISKGQADGF